jgi:hypothetical protein
MAYDRTLIQIRERSSLDILDLSLVVVRRWPVPLGLAALAGVAPFAALNFLLMSERGLSFLMLAPVLVLESPWATAPLTIVLGGLLFNEQPRVRTVLRRLLSALPALILTQLIFRAFFLFTIVFYPLIASRFAFLNEVILLERARGFQPIRRSGILSRAREGGLLSLWLGQIFFGAVFVVCFSAGMRFITSVIIKGESTWYEESTKNLQSFRFQAACWLAISFFGVARFLTYIDQRIRLEGWAVELTLRSAGRAMEERQG